MLAAIPVVGGSITEALSVVLTPAVGRRRDIWIKELAEVLDQLESKVDGFKVADLPNNEVFVSTLIEASRAAISTHRQERRKVLRNVVLNVALGQGPDEDEAEMFLRYVEELTPWHIRILMCLADRKMENTWFGSVLPDDDARRLQIREEWLLSTFPDLKGREALYDQVVLDLYQRGLLSYNAVRGSQTPPPHQQTETRANAFLRFISSPI